MEDEQENYEEHWNGKTTNQFHTRELRLKAQITLSDERTFEVQTLVDSGCTTSTIDKGFVEAKGIQTIPVNHPTKVYNADGTPNGDGLITEYVTIRMKIHEHEEEIELVVGSLGKHEVYLGHNWLQ